MGYCSLSTPLRARFPRPASCSVGRSRRGPIIPVVNKVDRRDARIAEVVEETYEPFLDLLDDDSSDGLDFPVVYASAKAGRASLTAPDNGEMPDSGDLGPCSPRSWSTSRPPLHRGSDARHMRDQPRRPYLGASALCRIVAGTCDAIRMSPGAVPMARSVPSSF